MRFGFVGASCLIGGLGAGATYLLARALGGGVRRSALLAVAAWFGTFAWVLTRSAWTDVPVAALTTAALAYSFASIRTAGGTSDRHVAWAGFLLGCALWFRLSAVLTIPLILLYLVLAGPPVEFRTRIRRVVWFAYGLGPVVAALGVMNLWRFGSPFESGYRDLLFDTPIGSGLAGLLWSPGRGVLWYATPAVLGLLALPWAIKRRRPETLLVLALALATLLFFARFSDWDGGVTYGPRYLLVVVAPLVALAATFPATKGLQRLMVVTASLGVLVHGALGVPVSFLTTYNRARSEVIKRLDHPPADPKSERALRLEVHEHWSSSHFVVAARVIRTTPINHLRDLQQGRPEGIVESGPAEGRASRNLPSDVYRRSPAEAVLPKGPSTVDVWWLRLPVAGAPVWIVLCAPVFLFALVASGNMLVRSLRRTTEGQSPNGLSGAKESP